MQQLYIVVYAAKQKYGETLQFLLCRNHAITMLFVLLQRSSHLRGGMHVSVAICVQYMLAFDDECIRGREGGTH